MLIHFVNAVEMKNTLRTRAYMYAALHTSWRLIDRLADTFHPHAHQPFFFLNSCLDVNTSHVDLLVWWRSVMFRRHEDFAPRSSCMLCWLRKWMCFSSGFESSLTWVEFNCCKNVAVLKKPGRRCCEDRVKHSCLTFAERGRELCNVTPCIRADGMVHLLVAVDVKISMVKKAYCSGIILFSMCGVNLLPDTLHGPDL